LKNVFKESGELKELREFLLLDFMDPEDGGSILIQNIANYASVYMTSSYPILEIA